MPADGRVLVFGSINADLIFRMDQLPAPGQTLLAETLTVQPGGKGANQAVAARKDGATVYMVGAVGDDALATAALEGLRAAGVNLDAVRHLPGVPTGCASICTDRAGRNQIAVALGANALVTANQIAPARLDPATTVLLQMEGDPHAIAAVIGQAQASQCRVILNLAPAIMLDREVLQRLDLLVVNEDEAEVLAAALSCQAGAQALAQALGIGIIRTLGAAGAEAATAEGAWHVPAPPVEAVDTTAAGDCFVGVLGAALSRGTPLRPAMHRACTAAALACTRPGSQRSLPDGEAIDAGQKALSL